MSKRALISILNFNGFLDTKECLITILNNECLDEFTIFILDNGSNSENVENLNKLIRELSKAYNLNYYIGDFKDNDIVKFDRYELVLICSDENYGFAKGNNILFRIGQKFDYQYYILLNNDTIIRNNVITKVITYMERNSNYGVATANIVYYDAPDKTWNAGGKIALGFQWYYSSNKINFLTNKQVEVKNTEFVSGCFMCIKKSILDNYGLLNEDFFFGEEDYEFCMKMKKNNIKMCSIINEKIYHKVSASINKDLKDKLYRKKLQYYSSRCIDMKSFYSYWQWNVWYIIYKIILNLKLLLNEHFSFKRANRFMYLLDEIVLKEKKMDRKLFNLILFDPEYNI